MRLVVADTGPINYLILIGLVDLLPALFERTLLPATVETELLSPDAPPLVARWMTHPPDWLEVIPIQTTGPIAGLHKGESDAIRVATSVMADLLLIDERRGAREAKRQGLRVTGTLGVLDLAAERGLVDFADAIRLLEATSFRKPVALLSGLLQKHNTAQSRQ